MAQNKAIKQRKGKGRQNTRALQVYTCGYDPPKKMVEEIETIICRFIQTGNYRTIREQIFLPKEMGGLGIPHVKEFWKTLRLGWLKRTFHSESFWLELLKENCKVKCRHYFGRRKN